MLVEIRQLDKSLICTTPAASNGNRNGQYIALVTLHAKLQQCIAGTKAAKQEAIRIEGWLGYVALQGHEQCIAGSVLGVMPAT